MGSLPQSQHASAPNQPNHSESVGAMVTHFRQSSNGTVQQQQPPPNQGQSNYNNGIKRGPKKVDRIFASQVDPTVDSTTLKDHIHKFSGIENDHIQVEYLFSNRNNNKAFKITVPDGKMQLTIDVLGTDIKAEPYKDRSYKKNNYTNGQASSSNWNSTNRGKSRIPFRGPPPSRGPPSRRFNGRPSNWGYATPEWRGWDYPHFY